MSPIVERVTESVELGEGPHWDEETQSLYYVDIFGKTIHKYVPSTKKHTKVVLDNVVSFVIPVEGKKDQFVVAIGRQVAKITWDGISEKISNTEKLAEFDDLPEVHSNRINDGKADPAGRLWAGTMGPEPVVGEIEPEKGTLYSLDAKKDIKAHVSAVTISNGLAWNKALQKFYYIDSLKRSIDQYDYDIKSGTISNPETIFTFDKHDIDGLPDGQTIDTDGNLWVAVFNGSKVIKINPNEPETLLDTVEIPAKEVTSVAFGGPNLDELYVTSARVAWEGVILEAPVHGATYKVTGIGAKGFPATKVKF